jgi:hypothetical protein
MTNSINHNNINELLNSETDILDVFDYYVTLINTKGKDNHYLNSIIFNNITSHIIRKNTRKEATLLLDILATKLEPLLINNINIMFNKFIFLSYLNLAVFSDKWNFLNKLKKEEKISIFYLCLSENNIIERIKNKKIDLTKYLNEDRKFGGGLNLKEKTLLLYLYSNYPQRKSTKKTYELISSEFPYLEINHTIIQNKINIVKIFSQNYFNLEQGVRDLLNKNTYTIKNYKTEIQLHTEEAILLNLMKIGSESLTSHGYFYLPEGGQDTNINNFWKVFIKYPKMREILIDFIKTKFNQAKIPTSKKIWLEMSLAISNNNQEQKNKKLIKL